MARTTVVGRCIAVLVSFVLSLCAGRTRAGERVGPPGTDAEIRALLQKCVDKQHLAPGIAVGLISDKGTQIVCYGERNRGKGDAVDGDTIFEIGSITKVFTTLLLQDMVDHGEVKLEDAIDEYLPVGTKTPSRDGKKIRLVDLATHTSGLPGSPDNFAPADGDDPWADYTLDRLYAFLATYKLPQAIGQKHEYSNVGMGLLGHLLALKAGTRYEALLVKRVCDPLALNSTRQTLTKEMEARRATGHAECGVPVKHWNSAALEGDGALFSSMNDMVKFLAASMGKSQSPLAAEIAKTQTPRHSAGLFMKVGLGWHIFGIPTMNPITWDNGGTGGFRSYIGIDLKTHRGVVVLANSDSSMDELGQYLVGLGDEYDDSTSPKQRTVAKLDERILDALAGRYKKKGSNQTLAITRDGDHLVAQQTGGPRYQVLPESETEFFFTAADMQLTFVRDASGKTIRLIDHEDNKNEIWEKQP